ncbi:MAG: hypothetical protein HOE90_16545 [Bacteriovoracaceae bacterium]|jgi:ketol-acid reductoisomerase|nr:hypothetical protein [Bacteriovoracaceae bacterium]
MEETTNRKLIIGFGNQAKAWAFNLRDSGFTPVHYLRKDSTSVSSVVACGFEYIQDKLTELEDFKEILMLIPDEAHAKCLEVIYPYLSEGSSVIYAHGFSLAAMGLKKKFPKLEHLLLAPKAIASELRFQFETKGNIAAVMSSENSKDIQAADKLLTELATAIGITHGPYRVSMEEETKADLFSEQSLLCSLIPYAGLKCYQKLRQRGIGTELAYLECWFEIKLIVDALMKVGPVDFFDLISPNALLGSEKGRELIFDEKFEMNLDRILDDIWSDKFFEEASGQNIEMTRKRVKSFWKKQELSTTHNEMGLFK